MVHLHLLMGMNEYCQATLYELPLPPLLQHIQSRTDLQYPLHLQQYRQSHQCKQLDQNTDKEYRVPWYPHFLQNPRLLH
jgi:hypothetical protein